MTLFYALVAFAMFCGAVGAMLARQDIGIGGLIGFTAVGWVALQLGYFFGAMSVGE